MNWILKMFNRKIIKTIDVINYNGTEYNLPLKPLRPARITDKNGRLFPIEFQNEEDRNFFLRVIKEAT
tara:strand:- start:6870 stop:7073 length:204 start_codon:yes stop_codon:yes gene_type:complete